MNRPMAYSVARSTPSRLGKRLRATAAVSVGTLIVFCLHALAFADTTPTVSSVSSSSVAKFTPRLYIGAGFGSSELNPEHETNAFGVTDGSSTGHHITLGYDLSRWLSAEVYFADIGEAEVNFLGTDIGPVDYSVAGVSAIAYLVNNQSGTLLSRNNGRGMHRREGLSLYARAGLGTIDNDTDIDYHRDYAVHVAVGLGAEYGFKNGFALRGEYTSFDADAQYASLSLLKRFGKVRDAAVPVAAVARNVPADAADPVAPSEPSIDNRQYAATNAPFIYFGFDQDTLNPTSRAQLKAFATEVNKGEYTMVIEGHADWVGSEAYNLGLSDRRADAVYQFMIAQGVDASRMSKKGYGETKPNNSNHTAAGRSQNRRVEFFIN